MTQRKLLNNLPINLFHPSHCPLHANYKLLNDETIAAIKKELADKPCGRYGKLELQKKLAGSDKPEIIIHYGIMKTEQSLYAVYNEDQKEFFVGTGVRGQLKYLQDLNNGEWYVLKTQLLAKPNAVVSDPVKAKYQKTFASEYQILSKLGISHDSALIRPSRKSPAVKADIIMRYVPGKSLKKVLEARRSLKDYPALYWLNIYILLLKEVKKLHGQGILHRDLKWENVQYDLATQRVTLLDMGSAVEKLEYFGHRSVSDKTFAAPELAEEAAYTQASEVYALGKFKVKLLFGKDKLESSRTKHSNKPSAISTDHPKSAKTIFASWKASLKPSLKNSIKEMLSEYPDKRPLLEKEIMYMEKYRAEYEKAFPDEVGQLQNIQKRAIQEAESYLDSVLKKLDPPKTVTVEKVEDPSRLSKETVGDEKIIAPEEKSTDKSLAKIIIAMGLNAKRLHRITCDHRFEEKEPIPNTAEKESTELQSAEKATP